MVRMIDTTNRQHAELPDTENEMSRRYLRMIEHMIMREVSISGAADLYLLHRLFGPAPSPSPTEEMESRLSGVRHFPHAGFVHPLCQPARRSRLVL